MNWVKLGQIYEFKSFHQKLLSHAANPLAVHLKNDIYRIFFSSRDSNSKSSVSFVDIDIELKKTICENKKPVILYGDEKSFYSHGISIGNIYTVNSEKYMLFMGWQIRDGKHWRGDIGRLRLIGDDSLVLDPCEAFMEADEYDPVSLSYPWIIYDENKYKMWYGSTITWETENGEMLHVIKYATSGDGVNWQKHGIAIPYIIGEAQAFSRPTVIRDNSGYHMWFSFRSGEGTKYRIGYAYSNDGILWERFADSGIDVSVNGWDSEMICYPFVFDHKGKRYMLYNGNSYGISGFGLAVLERN